LAATDCHPLSTLVLPEPISNLDLQPSDIPAADATWDAIQTFALTYNGFKVHGSFDACAAIANDQRNQTIDDLRTCLFFEQRRWHHYGDEPDSEAMDYIRSLLPLLRVKLAADRPGG
jgi:hypothetical protein